MLGDRPDRALDQLCEDLSVQPGTDGPGRLTWRVEAPVALRDLFVDLIAEALRLWSTADVERVRLCAFCGPRCATRTRVERHRRAASDASTAR